MKTFLIALVLVSAVILISPVSASAAANAGVKPGSFWYGFDLAFEKINLFFTFNSEGKSRKALEYADERLAEAEAVAENNNTDAVKTAIANYESNIAFAAEKAKDVGEKEKAEALLTSIADNTSKHQEILADVLAKVPDEAKEAITKAIEASRKGQEEAMQKIAELKGEVEKLKQEVVELKIKDEEREKAIEELSKQQSESAKAKTEEQSYDSNPPLNSVLCNGKYWTPTCPAGQKFYCPSSGDAQCLIENTQTPTTYQDPQIKIEVCKIEAQTSIKNFLEAGKAAANEGFQICVQNRLATIQQQLGGGGVAPGTLGAMADLARSSCKNSAQEGLDFLQSKADEMYNREYLVCLNK